MDLVGVRTVRFVRNTFLDHKKQRIFFNYTMVRIWSDWRPFDMYTGFS